MATRTIHLHGRTETSSGDQNNQTLDVVGPGTLVLDHDANHADITSSKGAVIDLHHDFNNGTADFKSGSFDILHDANNADIKSSAGSVDVGHDFNKGSASLKNELFTVGHDANKSTFDFIGGVSTVEIDHNFNKGSLENLDVGDRVELGIVFNGVSLHGSKLTLTENGKPVGQPIDVSFAPGAPHNFTVGVDNKTGLDFFQVACFAAGTRIMTARGEVAVEELRVGELVVTLSGKGAALKPVRWIGERRIEIASHPHPDTVRPVRIRAAAFADGLPIRDLVVSPDHAIAINGVLINAGKLINGVSITQELAARSVHYFHVELDGHDILLGDGMPAESYLDTGNRGQFANAAQVVALHPDFRAKRMQTDACWRFVEDGPELAAVRQQLIDRLTAQGYELSDNPGLRLVVDGRVVRPIYADGLTYRFLLPDGSQEIRIASRSQWPSGCTVANADCRRLGVCLGEIVANGDGIVRTIPLDDPALAEGFHAPETNGIASWRWTNGDARLPAALLAGAATLELRLQWPGAYWIAAPRHSELLRTSA